MSGSDGHTGDPRLYQAAFAATIKGAVAVVGLDDVGMIDAPSVRVAETTIDVVDGGGADSVRFSVDEQLLSSNSYVLAAEVRRSSKSRLIRGDFLTTVAFPWTPHHCGEQVLDVVKI